MAHRNHKRRDANLELALDYFGGDEQKAQVFVEVLCQTQMTPENARRIANEHFDEDLSVASRFLDASASLQGHSGIFPQSTQHQESTFEGNHTDGADDSVGSDSVARSRGGSGLPSLALNRKEADKSISVEDLRRMENVAVPGKNGRPVRLLSARRPRSYTHEIFKRAGLNYHRGQAIFSKPNPMYQTSLRSVSGQNDLRRRVNTFDSQPAKAGDQLGRSETSMGIVARESPKPLASVTRSLREADGADHHFRSPPQLRPVSVPPSIPGMLKRTTDDQDKIRLQLAKPWWNSFTARSMQAERHRASHGAPRSLTISLPKLCDVPGSTTSSCLLQVGSQTLQASTAEYSDILAENPVAQESEARDIKERVILFLRDRFQIDLTGQDFPLRCVPDPALTRAALEQKRSLNPHMLDFPVQVVAIRGEQKLPTALARSMREKRTGSLKRNILERASVQRFVVEILYAKGLLRHQLAAEIAKEIGRCFLFVNDFHGLNSSTEAGFSELCRYLWVTSEREAAERARERADRFVQDLQQQLEAVEAELCEVRLTVESAHRERAEADEAEDVAKRKLSAAKDAQLYGWPGAARKMEAARQAELEARRELDEAVGAEAMVMGEQLPQAEARERQLRQNIREAEAERSRNQQLAAALGVYLAAQENNPHPVRGDAFRRALLGFNSIDGDMAAFLEHLRREKTFVAPRQKTDAERMAEEEAALQLIFERQEAERKERNDRMELAVKQMISRQEGAAPGAPGPPADLLHPEPVVRVHAEAAESYEEQVMDDLQDRIMLAERGKLSSHELAEFCALQIHNGHDPVYCYKAGMVTFQQAKDFRAEGDLEQAKRALDKAKSAFNHAGAEGESKMFELTRIEKLVLREQQQLQMAISFHKQAEAAAASGALEVFRKHWSEAHSLYSSCGASSHKPDMLEALEQLDLLVRGQEVELKATNEALATASAAFEQREMDTAARHIAIAKTAMAKAGAAGKLKAEEAQALQAAMVQTLQHIAQTAEQGARAALDADDLEGAEVCIAETWRASRLAAVALGKVGADAGEKKLRDAERSQAKQQHSTVVSLAAEVSGTREQGKAFAVMERLTLTSWPAREAEVASHLDKCKRTLEHLTAARGLLEEAGNEESKQKVLALQKVELDLAVRLSANSKVSDLLVKHHENPMGAMDGGLPFVCLAAAANNPEGIDLLISKGAEVNAVDENGNTPVHHAVLSQAHNALRKLSEYRRCNPNRKNLQDRTPLHETVTAHRDLPAAKRMKAVWKSSRALAISTAISEAATVDAQHRYKEALTILLTAFPKLNPNLPTGPLAQTPLHLAAEGGNREAVAELLQHPKIEANACDKRGRSPLMAGVWRMKSVRELLTSDKIDVNMRLQDKGWSACHVCIAKNNMTALDELLTSPRVDLAIEDHMGWTPMHLAVHENSLRGVEKLLRSPAMEQSGFKLCEMMRAANALRHRGDPSATGIWDQAAPDVLERLPVLLLGCRQWEFLHDVLCSIAFLSAVISNFGVDKAVDLFEATVMAVRQWPGIRPATVSELERYKLALETRARDLRQGKQEFSLVAFDHTLWGVKAMKIAVEQVVESMVEMGNLASQPAVAHSQQMSITSKFFKVYNPLKRIWSNGLLRLVSNSSELPQASEAIKKIFVNRDDGYIKEEISRVLREEASEFRTEQSHQRAIGQLASLLEVFGGSMSVQTIKVVLDQAVEDCDVQQVRSTLCVAFHQIVEQYDSVHMRALRTYGHMDQTIVLIEVTNSPFHSAYAKDAEIIDTVIRRILEAFAHDDRRARECKQELKIVSIGRGIPSVFVIFEILCPQALVRRFRNQEDFAAQLLTDVRFCCNAKPHLLRVARTSRTWNSIVVEFLQDDAWTKSDRNIVQANRVVEEADIAGSNLRKGVLTAHVVAARCVRSTVPPLMNGEWKHSNLHIVGLEAEMHNERAFLEQYVLPAVQVIGVNKRCYFTWRHWSADHEPAKVDAQIKSALSTPVSDGREAANGFNFVVAVLGHRKPRVLHPMTDEALPATPLQSEHDGPGDVSPGQEEPATGAPLERVVLPGGSSGRTSRTTVDIVVQQSVIEKPYGHNSFVFLRDPEYLAQLEQAENPALRRCMSDEPGSVDRSGVEKTRDACMAASRSRCCHYTPAVGDVNHDPDAVHAALQSNLEQLKALNDNLQKVEVQAAKDQSYETRRVVYKGAVDSTRREVLRWRGMLSEEQLKSAEDPALQSVSHLTQLEEGEVVDMDDMRALGVGLDVSWGMFQLGLAMTDALFAQLEGVASAPPFHSHLSSREQQHALLEQTGGRFVFCPGEPRTELLQALVQSVCIPASDRVPLLVVGGAKNSGRSTLLAAAVTELLTVPPGKSTPDLIVYHGRNGAPFPSFLRHLCLEIALQASGGDGLDLVPGSRATDECLTMLHREILKAFELDLSLVLVLDELEEPEQVMVMRVVLQCHEVCKSARYISIQCVLSSDNPEKLGKAVQAAGVLENIKDEGLVKLLRIKGLSKPEQSAIFVSFSQRFSDTQVSEEEIRFLAAKQDADNPLYLLLFAHAKYLRALQGRTLPLDNVPSTLAPMWKHLVLPNMAEACRTVPEVVETALRILTAHPSGVSLSTFLSSIKEAHGSNVGVSLSQLQRVVDSIEPLLRPGTDDSESIALAHPQILTSQIDDSAVAARNTQSLDQGALRALMFGMNMENEHESSLSPDIVQEITALRWHFHDLFMARFVMPMVAASGLALAEDTEEGTFGDEKAKAKRAIFALRDPQDRTKTLQDIARHGAERQSHAALMLDLVQGWNAKLQDLASSSPLRKAAEEKTEASFSNFYTCREKVDAVMEELDDEYFQVPLTILQGITFTEIAVQPWLRDSVKVTSADVAKDLSSAMSEHKDEALSELARAWKSFDTLTKALQRERQQVEAECVRLEGLLVREQTELLDNENSTPPVLAKLLQDRIIDVVIEFRSWIELRVRQAKENVGKVRSAKWREVSHKYIRAHCEDLEASLADCVEQVKKVSHHVAERKFRGALQALHDYLESEEIAGAWEQYRIAKACGYINSEEADAAPDASVGRDLRVLASYEQRLKDAEALLSTSARSCIAFGPGLEGGKCGLPTVVKIRARNFRGSNQKKGDGTDRWNVRVACGKMTMPVDVCDNQDGTYDCHFVPSKPGKYSIDIAYVERNSSEALPLIGSPWSVAYEENIPWTAAHVSGMVSHIDARTHVAASGERIVVIATEVSEVHVMQPEGNGAWRCEEAKLIGDLMQPGSIKGVQTLPDGQLLCLCSADANRFDSIGGDDDQQEEFAFFLLEVKAISTIRVQRIRHSSRIPVPQDYRPQPSALWEWENSQCGMNIPPSELAELDMLLVPVEAVASSDAKLPSDEEISRLVSDGGGQASGPMSASREFPSEQRKSLTSDTLGAKRDSSDDRYKFVSMQTFIERRGLKTSKDPPVKDTTSRYIDFSVPLVVATCSAPARNHDGISMLMLNFVPDAGVSTLRLSDLSLDRGLMVFGGCDAEDFIVATVHDQPDAAEGMPVSRRPLGPDEISWSSVEVSGEIPCVRSHFSLGRSSEFALLHGGRDEQGRTLNDVCVLDLGTHVWRRILVMARPSKVTATYAFCPGVIAGIVAAKPPRMHVLDYAKLLRGSKIPRCEQSAEEHLKQLGLFLDETHKGIQSSNPQAVKHAVYHAKIHSQMETRMQELKELRAFLEREGVPVQHLHDEFEAFQVRLSRLDKLASDVKVRLQRDVKYHQLKAESSDTVKNIVLFSAMAIANNPAHTVFDVGYGKAMESIQSSLRKLKEKRDQCMVEEQVELFFGQVDALAGAKQNLDHQKSLLEKLATMWDMIEDLTSLATMTLQDPRATDVQHFRDWKQHLEDIVGHDQELLETDVACEAEHLVENAIDASQWLARFRISDMKDVMALSRVIFHLSGHILSPPTFMTLLQSEVVHDEALQKFAKTANDDDAKLSLSDICIRAPPTLTDMPRPTSRSMHSSSCFCQVTAAALRPLKPKGQNRLYPAESGELKQTQVLTIAFSHFGQRPGASVQEAERCHIRCGLHSAFTCFAPWRVTYQAAKPGGADDAAVPTLYGQIRVRVGVEEGPFVFSFGEDYTDILLLQSDVEAGSEPQTRLLTAQPLPMPEATWDHDRRYSRCELQAELASMKRHHKDVEDAAHRSADEEAKRETVEETTPILHDSMNRPVVVDGCVRGAGRFAFFSAHSWDGVGRVVVEDGIGRIGSLRDTQSMPPGQGQSFHHKASTSEALADVTPTQPNAEAPGNLTQPNPEPRVEDNQEEDTAQDAPPVVRRAPSRVSFKVDVEPEAGAES